jgi:hypothetical protein
MEKKNNREETPKERWNDFVKQEFTFFKKIYSSEDEMKLLPKIPTDLWNISRGV